MGDAVKSSPGTEMDDTTAAPRLRQAERDAPHQGHGDTPASSGASQGNVAQSSPLEDRLASEVRDALEWRDGPDFQTSPVGDKVEFACGNCKTIVIAPEDWEPSLCPRCGLDALAIVEHVGPIEECMGSHPEASQVRDQEVALAWIAAKAQEWAESETPPERKATMLLLANVARSANPPAEVNEPCADACGRPAEIILLYPNKRISKCINCLLIAAMKRPCSICGQHITEAITRALDQQGKPNTIGVCMQCLYKADQAQRN